MDSWWETPIHLEFLNNIKSSTITGNIPVVVLPKHIPEGFHNELNRLFKSNGNYKLERGKLEEFDLVVLVEPVDLLYWLNRQNSTVHMVTKKNKFGYKKFRFEKGSDGKRNPGILLRLPKVLVLDKVKKQK